MKIYSDSVASIGGNVVFGNKVDPNLSVTGGLKGGCDSKKGICQMSVNVIQGSVSVEIAVNPSLPLELTFTFSLAELTAKQPDQLVYFKGTSGYYYFDQDYVLNDSIFANLNLPTKSAILTSDHNWYNINGDVVTLISRFSHDKVSATTTVLFGSRPDGSGKGINPSFPSDAGNAIQVAFTFIESRVLTLSFSISSLSASQPSQTVYFNEVSGSYPFDIPFPLSSSFFQQICVPPGTVIGTTDPSSYVLDGDTITLTIKVNSIVGNAVFGAPDGKDCNNNVPGIYSLSADAATAQAQGQSISSVPVVFSVTPTLYTYPGPYAYLQMTFDLGLLKKNQPSQSALFARESGSYAFADNYMLTSPVLSKIGLPANSEVVATDPSIFVVDSIANTVTITITICNYVDGFVIFGDSTDGGCNMTAAGICAFPDSSAPISGVTPVPAIFTLVSVETLYLSFKYSDLVANQPTQIPYFSDVVTGNGGSDYPFSKNYILPLAITNLLGLVAGASIIDSGSAWMSYNKAADVVTINCSIAQP